MSNFYTYLPFFLNEIAIHQASEQIYLLTLVMVFSLVAYLFVKNRTPSALDLSHSEQHLLLKTILETSQKPLVYLSKEGKLAYANALFFVLCDKSPDDIVGRSASNAGIDFDSIKRADDCKISTFSSQINGRAVLVTANRLCNYDGEVEGYYVLFEPEDPSADEVDLKDLAHELRTPLNAIFGFSELLKSDEELSRHQQTLFRKISEQSDLLKQKIEKLVLLEKSLEDAPVCEENMYLRQNNIESVLVVDDVTINRTLLRLILERRGYVVREAENGEAAVEMVKRERPDLILMDLLMPVMNGFDAVVQIRQMGKDTLDIPIIAVTASSENTLQELKERGFDELLHKPFREERLFELVQQVAASAK
ncbi:MAG: response regulator [Balneolaceae bacterium]